MTAARGHRRARVTSWCAGAVALFLFAVVLPSCAAHREQRGSKTPAEAMGQADSPAAAPGAAAARAWTWHATLRGGGDVDVGAIDHVLCFHDAPPAHVGPEHTAALAFLMDVPRRADVVDAAPGALGPALAVDDVGIVTKGLPAGACIAFSIDLEAASERLRRLDLAGRVGRAVVASPDVWLWRPRPWAFGQTGGLVVDVASDAAGATLAAPFQVDDDGAWRVPGSTYALQCYAAMGRLRESHIARAGAVLHVVRVADGGLDDDTLQRWLLAAVDDVAAPLRRFPVDRALVIVVPGWGARRIGGGFLGRGGGASVVVEIGRGPFASPPSSGDGDDDGRWVLTHELAHALLPPVTRGDGWLNEGVATWHQEMLPAFAGRRDVDSAHAQLALGVRTGRARAEADRLTLDVACNEMDARHSYQHCYWGGAALTALLADDIGNDAVLALVRALHDSAPLDATPRSARELLHHVAVEASDAVAADAARRLWALWERFRDAPFPDVTGLFTRSEHAG